MFLLLSECLFAVFHCEDQSTSGFPENFFMILRSVFFSLLLSPPGSKASL